jgi:hypothetical protein
MKRHRGASVVVVVLLLVVPATPGAVGFGAPRALPDAAWLAEHVRALTAPVMEGRGSGTAGGERAARYLADALQAYGLEPGGDRGAFLQPFTVTRGPRLADGNALVLTAPARVTLAAGADFVPHGGSPDADLSADVVHAGHGIVAPEQGVDDYAGLDVRGRIVMARAGSPDRWHGRVPSRLDRLIEARARGAAALLLVDETLPALDATATRVDLPSATMTAQAAARLLAAAGSGLEGPARAVPGARARLRVALASEDRRAANVIGVLRGAGSPRETGGPWPSAGTIVVGAHYDHLGRVGDDVYAGADDNASGTAVVLGLARALAAQPRPGRTIVFALFSGEELGLLGSRHYVEALGPGIEQVAVMLNFDMVGRLRQDRLSVGGMGSGTGLRAAVEGAAQGTPIDVALHDTPFGPSDHARFYSAGVPVVFFHTGRHDDYHRPSDTADKIDAAGMARIAAVGLRLVERLAGQPRPQYVKLAPPARRTVGRTGEPFFGIAADGGGRGDGVRVTSVVPDSTAAKLGLAEGDVLVRFADVPLDRFTDLLDAVRSRRPGERVRVVYLREGAPRAGSETLGARP